MARQDLQITLNSDDPTVFHADIGDEFVRMTEAARWTPGQIRTFCMTAVDASAMPDDDKRAMRRDAERELNQLESTLATAS